MQHLLTVAEAAQRLRTSPQTVRNLCRRQILPYTRPSGPAGPYRFLPDHLDEYVQRSSSSGVDHGAEARKAKTMLEASLHPKTLAELKKLL
jgi:excisionase family DNA binding protein